MDYVQHVAAKWDGKILHDRWTTATKLHKPDKAVENLFMLPLVLKKIQDFVNAGGDVDVRVRGCTLLHVACQMALDISEDGMTIISPEMIEIVKWLLENKANPNASASNGERPFQFGWDKLEIVQLLLAAGADPIAADIKGWTTLHYACYGSVAGGSLGDPADISPILELLLKAGADSTMESTKPYSSGGDLKVPKGAKPIHCAFQGFTDAIPVLYAFPGSRLDSEGNTLLHLLATQKSTYPDRLVPVFADELNIPLNELNKFEWTALHYACWYIVNVELIQELLKRGADVSIKSTGAHKRFPKGTLPLDIALKDESSQGKIAVELLQQIKI